MSWPERFWLKVDRTGDPDACWPWTAAHDNSGYGWIWFQGRVQRAHRVSYEMTYGLIPSGLLACHRCDNPPCVNPAHLFLGTDADNAADRDAKGRRAGGGWFYEAGNRHATLTFARVTELRAAHNNGESGRSLARRFGISKTSVARLVRLQCRVAA